MSDNNGPASVVTQIIAPVADKSSAPQAEAPVPAPVETPAATPAPVDEFSSRFAALTRQEKKVQEEKAKAKAEAERWSKYAELDKKAKEDPLSVLATYGLDLDTIIAASLGHQKAPPTVEEQLAELKAQLQAEKDDARRQQEEAEKAKADAYQASIDEAILNHQNSITEHLSKNRDKYELISLHGVEDLVWETTEAYFEANQKVLSPAEAADMVEQYLEEQAIKAAEIAKLKAKIAPPAAKPQEPTRKGTFLSETQVNPLANANNARTLSQNLAGVAPEKTSTERLTPEESKRRAAEFLKQAWAKNS